MPRTTVASSPFRAVSPKGALFRVPAQVDLAFPMIGAAACWRRPQAGIGHLLPFAAFVHGPTSPCRLSLRPGNSKKYGSKSYRHRDIPCLACSLLVLHWRVHQSFITVSIPPLFDNRRNSVSVVNLGPPYCMQHCKPIRLVAGKRPRGLGPGVTRPEDPLVLT